MVKVILVIYACLALLCGCMSEVKYDVCQSRSDEGFIAPLSKELAQRNIDHQIRGGQICYNSKDKEEVDRASTFVSAFRNGVATVIRDKDIEARIVSWLTKENKSYRITGTTDGERFVIIHSDSEADAESNRKELARLQRKE